MYIQRLSGWVIFLDRSDFELGRDLCAAPPIPGGLILWQQEPLIARVGRRPDFLAYLITARTVCPCVSRLMCVPMAVRPDVAISFVHEIRGNQGNHKTRMESGIHLH